MVCHTNVVQLTCIWPAVNMPNHIKAKVVGVEPAQDAGFIMATLESGGQVKLPDKVPKGATVTFRTDTGEMTGME